MENWMPLMGTRRAAVGLAAMIAALAPLALICAQPTEAASSGDAPAAEGCKPEYSFTDRLTVEEPRDNPVTGASPQYMYAYTTQFRFCGEDSLLYGIWAHSDAAKDPGLFSRNFVTGDVQTVVSGRNMKGQKEPYDRAAKPLACSSRGTVYYRYWYDSEYRIYYWTPGTVWNPLTEKERILPFPGMEALPSPDGKRVVLYGEMDNKTQSKALRIESLAAGASGLEVIGLPAGYWAHAWLTDSARLLVTRGDGGPENETRGIFDLRKPEQPFRRFDWPDQFQRLIDSRLNRGRRDFVDDGGDTYTVRFIREGMVNTAEVTSIVVLERCRFAADRVVCEPVGKPVELDIGDVWATHPKAPVLFYKTAFDRPWILRRYDAVSGSDKTVNKGGFSFPSPGGRFARAFWDEVPKVYVHSMDACK